MSKSQSHLKFPIACAFLLAFAASLLMTRALSARQDAQQSSLRTIAHPPVAPVRNVSDTYFGVTIPDPYRYMENLKDPKVAAWFKAENDYTRGVLAAIPGRDALLKRIQMFDEGAPAVVRDVRRLPGNHYFYQKRLASENVPKLYMRDGLAGPEKLLFDPAKFAHAAARITSSATTLPLPTDVTSSRASRPAAQKTP